MCICSHLSTLMSSWMVVNLVFMVCSKFIIQLLVFGFFSFSNSWVSLYFSSVILFCLSAVFWFRFLLLSSFKPSFFLLSSSLIASVLGVQLFLTVSGSTTIDVTNRLLIVCVILEVAALVLAIITMGSLSMVVFDFVALICDVVLWRLQLVSFCSSILLSSVVICVPL